MIIFSQDFKVSSQEVRKFYDLVNILANDMSEQVDLRKLNPNKPLDKTITTLELLLCSLAKHLDLRIK